MTAWAWAWPLIVPAAAVAASVTLRPARAQGRVAWACVIALWSLAADVAIRGPAGWDDAARWFALLVLVLGGITLAFSVHYVASEWARGAVREAEVRRYFALFETFILCLLAIAALPNFVAMWAAVEGSTLSTVLLVAFGGGRGPTEAAWKYLVVTGIGGLLALLGVVLVLHGAGLSLAGWSLRAAGLAPRLAPGGRVAVQAGLVLAVAGFGSKAGLVPFHTWLPDAHSEAPSPVSALLSGAKLAGGLYALLRLVAVAARVIGPVWPHVLLIGTGLASLGLAAAAIPGQRDLKRMFAYSSIEHMGVVALGAGFGGVGLLGALLHMWTHGLGKTALFCAAGNVRLRCGATGGPAVRGLLAGMPLTGAALALGAAAVVGIPPLGLFWSEWLVLQGGVQGGDWAWVAVALAFLLLNLIGFGLRLPDFLLGAPGAARSDGLGRRVAARGEPVASLWAVGLALLGVVVGGLGLATTWHGTWWQAANLLSGGVAP